MRFPVPPPVQNAAPSPLAGDGGALALDERGRYLPWEKVRHLPEAGGTHSGAMRLWLRMKAARRGMFRQLPFSDINGRPFVFCPLDLLGEFQHWMDQQAGGVMASGAQPGPEHERQKYILRSLTEESINSSQLEGAATTTRDARKMLQKKRKPRTKGEKMIANNYEAMLFIRERAGARKMTPELLLKLHDIVTRDTLPDSERGRFRGRDDIVVEDRGIVMHRPPPSVSLPGRVTKLCAFANGESPNHFLHPVLRAVLLHFALAYDHPFTDGNGRTARALFYWAMKRGGYWLAEYISISGAVKQAPAQYARAFLHVETDDNDATYFLLHQAKIIRKAVEDFRRHVESRAREQGAALARLGRVRAMGRFNPRQAALLERAIRRPDEIYDIAGHQIDNGVSYQTARTDLTRLADAGMLAMSKRGNAFVFAPVGDLRERLEGDGREV